MFNVLIQPQFGFACSAWYPNLNKKFKSKLQTIQNKCIRYCLHLHNRSHTEMTEFEKMIWFPSSERFYQYLCSNAFKLFKENCPHSYKKQKDSLKTRAVLLIFSFELEISGVAVQRINQKQWKMLAFVRNSSVKMILRLF